MSCTGVNLAPQSPSVPLPPPPLPSHLRQPRRPLSEPRAPSFFCDSEVFQLISLLFMTITSLPSLSLLPSLVLLSSFLMLPRPSRRRPHAPRHHRALKTFKLSREFSFRNLQTWRHLPRESETSLRCFRVCLTPSQWLVRVSCPYQVREGNALKKGKK